MAQIIVGTDGLCMCDCGTKCVCNANNTGIGLRCTEEMLIKEGHQPIRLHGKVDEKAMHDYTTIDGKEKRITISCIEVPLKKT